MYEKGMKLKYKLEKPTNFWREGQCSMYEFGDIEEIKLVEDGIVYLADRYVTLQGEIWVDDGVTFPFEIIDAMFEIVEG
jgi:hypothetical protein